MGAAIDPERAPRYDRHTSAGQGEADGVRGSHGTGRGGAGTDDRDRST